MKAEADKLVADSTAKFCTRMGGFREENLAAVLAETP